MRVALALALAITVGLVNPAQAQERLRISVNGGVQVGSQTVNQDFELPINLEQAPIANEIDLSSGPMFDIGAFYHLAQGLWAGVSFSFTSQTADGAVTASIPHPFFFNRPRDISGTVDDLESKERSIHISAGYLVPLSEKLDVMVFGGPSHFNIKQELITDVRYSETYPFDTATYTSATVVTASESTWGFHIGADVTWKLSEVFGVGGVVRFSRGSTTLTADPDNEADIDTGGVLLGGGLRVRF
jgi:hypothetical protein